MSEQERNMESMQSPIESEKTTELFEGDLPPTLIVPMRHTEYDNQKTEAILNVKDDPENWHRVKPGEEHCGEITERGVALTHEKIKKCMDEILEHGDPEKADFLVVASGTYWLDVGAFDDHETALEQRAARTGDIAIDEINSILEARGISAQHILNLRKKNAASGEKYTFKGNRRTPDGGARTSSYATSKLGETNIFWKSPEYISRAMEASGGDMRRFWEIYQDGTFSDVIKKEGGDTFEDLAERMNKYMQVLARFARMYHKNNPDRNLVIFSVSHSEVLESFAENKAGLKIRFPQSDYNETYPIGLDADSRNATMYKDGRKYNVPSVEIE